MPFFWGTDAEGHLVLSTDGEVVKQSCGKSFAPFPKGIVVISLNVAYFLSSCILCAQAIS